MDDTNNKVTRILLTGGSGMVGRNFLEHPSASEFEILAPFSHELDLRDATHVQKFMVKYRPDLIIHAAGKVGGIQANIHDPVAFLLDNLDMGRNVVVAARAAHVPRLLNLGSSCMYPHNASNPLVEEMILQGELEQTNEGYALAKIITAKLCQYINRQNNGFQYKTLIPCNLYGRHDKFDPANSHLIPAIIHKVHCAKENGLDVVEIWGDGTARREFMYAGDVADGIMRAVCHFDSLPDLMNLGIGYDYTINEYYQAVANVIGWNGDFKHDLSKPVGMKRKLVSIARQTNWGWSPVTSLTEGISKAYQFYLEECKK